MLPGPYFFSQLEEHSGRSHPKCSLSTLSLPSKTRLKRKVVYTLTAREGFLSEGSGFCVPDKENFFREGFFGGRESYHGYSS